MTPEQRLFEEQGLSILPEDFRAFLKANILHAMSITDKQIQNQFLSMIEKMVAQFNSQKFPQHNWEGLIDQLAAMVKATDKPNIKIFHAAFVVIVKVLKTFMFVLLIAILCFF